MAKAPVQVRRGTCSVLFAFDVGASIDLEAARRGVTDATEAARIEHKRHAPAYFQFEPPPLRVLQHVEPIAVGTWRTTATVDIVLYDFGATSVSYDLPIAGSPEDLVVLSCLLSESKALGEDARRRVEALLAHVGHGVEAPHLSPLVEDYVLWRLQEVEGAGVEELLRDHGPDLARILSSMRAPPAAEEVQDLLAHRVSFEADDVTLVDWNAALLVGRDMDDVCAVLEFANVQLLELRFLDGRLDRSLDRAYETLRVEPRGLRGLFRASGPALERVAQMQVDGAILFERVSNALKLLGDQFLARVYRVAALRFHLPAWNDAIRRKLETIDSVYEKLSDRAATRRLEALEWLVIVLIALSILLSVVLPLGH